MGLRCAFDIQDMGYNMFTPQLGIEPDYSEGFEIFAETFLEVATDLVPVDTGNLMSSINVDADDISVVCEADCEYAQYVEFGTYKMAAQPYFIPALEAALQEAKPAWDDAWDEALEEEQEELAAMEQESEGEEDGGGGLLGGLLGLVFAAVVIGLVKGFFNLVNDTDNTRNTNQISIQGSFPEYSEIESFVEVT